MYVLAAAAALAVLVALALGLAISWWWLRPGSDAALLDGASAAPDGGPEARGAGNTRGQLLAGALALLAGRALDAALPLPGTALERPAGPPWSTTRAGTVSA